MSSKVLVTGGSGYLGTQLIAALLRDEREVRATVRSLDGQADVRARTARSMRRRSRRRLFTLLAGAVR